MELIERLKKAIAATKNNISSMQVKMNENYLYHFEIGYADNLYFFHTELKHYKDFLAAIEDGYSAKEYIEYQITMMTDDIMKGFFTGRSSSQSDNRAFVIKKEVMCKVIQKFKGYLTNLDK